MSKISWFEKYKPKTIDDILGQNQPKKLLQQILINKDLPHILFHGPPGVGKSLMLYNFIKQFYHTYTDEMVMILNITDERGIKSVREKIKNFAKKSISKNIIEQGIDFKLIVLEEAETITPDAQTSLRRCIEQFSHITRFFMICNNINKVIDPIKSRFCIFYFNPILLNEANQLMIEICQQENLSYDPKYLEEIYNLSKGNIRQLINILKYFYIVYHKIDYESYHNYLQSKSIIVDKSLIDNIKDNNNNYIVELTQNFINQGFSVDIFLLQIIDFIINQDYFVEKLKSDLLNEIHNIEHRLNNGGDEFINLLYLLQFINQLLINY